MTEPRKAPLLRLRAGYRTLGPRAQWDTPRQIIASLSRHRVRIWTDKDDDNDGPG